MSTAFLFFFQRNIYIFENLHVWHTSIVSIIIFRYHRSYNIIISCEITSNKFYIFRTSTHAQITDCSLCTDAYVSQRHLAIKALTEASGSHSVWHELIQSEKEAWRSLAVSVTQLMLRWARLKRLSKRTPSRGWLLYYTKVKDVLVSYYSLHIIM